jgi:hypothetical protein
VLGGVPGVVPGARLPDPLGDDAPAIPTIPVPGATSLKDQLATGAEQTTGAAAGSVGALSPQAGDAVGAAGKTAGGAVRAVPLGG